MLKEDNEREKVLLTSQISILQKELDQKNEQMIKTEAELLEQFSNRFTSLIKEMDKDTPRAVVKLTDEEKKALRHEVMEWKIKAKKLEHLLKRQYSDLQRQLNLRDDIISKQRIEFSDVKEEYIERMQKIQKDLEFVQKELLSEQSLSRDMQREYETTVTVLRQRVDTYMKQAREKDDICKSLGQQIKSLSDRITVYKNELKKISSHSQESEEIQNEEIARKEKEIESYKEKIKQLSLQLEDKHRWVKRLSGEFGYGVTLSELVFGIAHQLRNPLGVVRLNVQFCTGKGKCSREARLQLESVMRNLDIIEQRLEIFREFTEPLMLNLELYSVNKALRSVVELISERCKENKIKIESILSEKLPDIPLDHSKIQSAFLQIASNAIDAMPKGGILRIISSFDAENDKVIVKFEDTGTGISEAQISQIFMPFFTTKENALGLGLCFVKQVIDAHGGKVEIQSMKDKGASAVMEFPLKSLQKENK